MSSAMGMDKASFWRNFAINMELNEEWIDINQEIWVCRTFNQFHFGAVPMYSKKDWCSPLVNGGGLRTVSRLNNGPFAGEL